jgi:hypothetical protein
LELTSSFHIPDFHASQSPSIFAFQIFVYPTFVDINTPLDRDFLKFYQKSRSFFFGLFRVGECLFLYVIPSFIRA